MPTEACEVAVIGAGIVGIAVAYHLAVRHRRRVAIVDPAPPMSLTSAASGENYRNWWPHPVMTRFTDRSIDLMEAIARDSGNRLHMTRRGYALATRRADVAPLVDQLHEGYGADADRRIRVHHPASGGSYRPAASADWEAAPDGVDVLLERALIRRTFPTFDPAVTAVLHVRRAGDISGQQMGQYMLERVREAGGRLVGARVTGIAVAGGFTLALDGGDGAASLRADAVVNAAGPHAAGIAAMLGETLPVVTIAQQKIAFEDRENTVPRTLPFAIDLDGQTIDWSGEDRALLAEDPETAWLAAPMPGGIHCRPDGGEHGRWIKLGWAFNAAEGAVEAPPPLNPQFPEIVLRGASRLQPALKSYYERLPRQTRHYGGYYTMTRENWPLIGPTATPGAFVAAALGGFGTMAACAAGDLCAAWIAGAALPDFAAPLSLRRYDDADLMARLAAMQSTGVL